MYPLIKHDDTFIIKYIYILHNRGNINILPVAVTNLGGTQNIFGLSHHATIDHVAMVSTASIASTLTVHPHPDQTSMVRPVDVILTLLTLFTLLTTFVTLVTPVKVLGTEKLSGCRNLSYLSSCEIELRDLTSPPFSLGLSKISRVILLCMSCLSIFQHTMYLQVRPKLGYHCLVCQHFPDFASLLRQRAAAPGAPQKTCWYLYLSQKMEFYTIQWSKNHPCFVGKSCRNPMNRWNNEPCGALCFGWSSII